MEEAIAADQGEYNDAKSSPSLQMVLPYLYRDNNPSTPLSLKCLLVCAFLFFNFSYNYSGQKIMRIFPQAGLKPTGNVAFLVL